MKPYQDRNDEGNGPLYNTGKKCITCHERPAGTAWSPHWCFECNVERMDRITRNMESILAGFEKKGS